VITRAQLIARSAVAAGGLYGAGAVAPLVERALAQQPIGDKGILSFALAIENFEAAFYKKALATKGLDGAVKKALTEIAAHEDAHAKQLKLTLDQLGAAGSGGTQAFSLALAGSASQNEVLTRAIKLEEIGLAAYNGAAPLLQSPDLLAALGSIAQVEGRHAGALRELAGNDPAPIAFDKAMSPAAADKRLRQGV
jgi:rubrerythrin